MLRKNKYYVSILFLTVIVSFMFLYAGHFLFEKKEEILLPKEQVFPISHKHMSLVFNGLKQEINLLEVDLKDERVKIKPILSHDSLFGFERLSSISKRTGAYAVVTAGFFHEYGQPSGMVVINGKLINNSTGKYPVLLIDQNQAALKEVKTKMWIEANGKKFPITNINTPGKPGEIIVYTGEYGPGNRVEIPHTSIVIQDRTVKAVIKAGKEDPIPHNGMLLTSFGSGDNEEGKLPFKAGDSVKFMYEPALESDGQAYECGSWIVKNNAVVIGERDVWTGVTTNHDPRTAVGIKGDGKVVLVTVDGRQEGYSYGFTGTELGEFLLSMGVVNAAMLDGGASTEMIIKNQIVNRPSNKGEERPLGGGIGIFVDNQPVLLEN